MNLLSAESADKKVPKEDTFMTEVGVLFTCRNSETTSERTLMMCVHFK